MNRPASDIRVPSMLPPWLKRLTLLLAAVALLTGTVAGQDKVTFRPDENSRPVVLIGEVLDYTGRGLTFRPTGGTPRTVPADHIDAIETHYDPGQLQGLDLFRRGETQAAQAKFREALKRDQREWVKREILSWLVRCAVRERDLPGAFMTFRELVLSDPETRHWGVAPLVWSPLSLSEALKSEGRQLLVAPRASDRLLGASLLLLDPVYGTPAERELSSLARDSNPRISSLARAQLWRLQLASRQISSETLESWASHVAYLPRTLRAGPQYLVARGYEVRGEPRRAAAEYLWVSQIYTENEQLAARATLDAAEASRGAGLTREADVLYREILSRFGWSPEAASARERLNAQAG